MIIKPIGDGKSVLAELELLRNAANRKRRPQIEEEIRIIRAGQKGESESAFLIDFDFAQSADMAVIHDLRIEFNGRVAQIDHLLIHRSLACFVLETKHVYAGVKITESGEFLRWNEFRKSYEGMPSPLAQNERHVAVLQDLFRSILNQEPWYSARPTFHPFILISPHARIDRPNQFDTKRVIKTDLLGAAVRETLAQMGETEPTSKIFSEEDLSRLAKIVAKHHRPVAFDYARKFGMESRREPKATKKEPFDSDRPPSAFLKPRRSRGNRVTPILVVLASLGGLYLLWSQYNTLLQGWITKSLSTPHYSQNKRSGTQPKTPLSGTPVINEQSISIRDQAGNQVPIIQGNLSKIRQQMRGTGLGTQHRPEQAASESEGSAEVCEPKPVMNDAEIEACRRERLHRRKAD